jgi:hypothetical protein
LFEVCSTFKELRHFLQIEWTFNLLCFLGRLFQLATEPVLFAVLDLVVFVVFQSFPMGAVCCILLGFFVPLVWLWVSAILALRWSDIDSSTCVGWLLALHVLFGLAIFARHCLRNPTSPIITLMPMPSLLQDFKAILPMSHSCWFSAERYMTFVLVVYEYAL